MSETRSKAFVIAKKKVWQAYQYVKANRGGCGVDEMSLDEFEENLRDNLYKLWNRLSSGSYFPSPVRRVDIPKTGGGVRSLGIPTVADRIVQKVVKMELEAKLEPIFHNWSYGYRCVRKKVRPSLFIRTYEFEKLSFSCRICLFSFFRRSIVGVF